MGYFHWSTKCLLIWMKMAFTAKTMLKLYALSRYNKRYVLGWKKYVFFSGNDRYTIITKWNDGLVQDCSIPTAKILQILQSCTKPSKCKKCLPVFKLWSRVGVFPAALTFTQFSTSWLLASLSWTLVKFGQGISSSSSKEQRVSGMTAMPFNEYHLCGASFVSLRSYFKVI